MAEGPGPDSGGAGRRRALLIGVRETPDLAGVPELRERYPRLDFVGRDLSLVETALKESDYEDPQVLEDTGKNRLIGAVSRFFGSCTAGDTALLYFSGHGETIDDRDHLVLSDSQAVWPQPEDGAALDPRTLLEADPGVLLRDLPQGVTAIICLDICRTSPRGERDPDTAEGGWLSGHDAYWLYSCGAGQRSFADPVTGSWFAQALAEALSQRTSPTTFHEVVRYTHEELQRLADKHGQVEPPTVAKQLPWPGQDAAHRDPVMCTGSQETLEWTRVIRTSGLWNSTAQPAVHERVKDRLEELVRCVVGSSAGTAAHRDDPWSDPRYPVRVEERLADLVDRAGLHGTGELLSPAETACLLAAPIVHEGVVTIALDELRRLLPEGIDPGPVSQDTTTDVHSRQVRDAARDVCRAHKLVLRTAETLRSRSLKEATTAADHWLRHRFVADWDRLWEWDRPGTYEAVDTLVRMVREAVEAAAPTPSAGPRTDADRDRVDKQIRQVVSHLTVRPGTNPRINDLANGDQWIDHTPVRGNQWRGRQLANLLWTAGLLAADSRRLSSVVVDHLGAHDPLVPRQVAGALQGFDYEPADGRTATTQGLSMRFVCPHPALHAALEELALTADAALRSLRADSATQPLLRGLPDRVTTAELRPLPGRYQVPLERFRLAEDEVRPLLMGTQLYGDRMLAVRELYQNALDACRYRDMRRQYGGTRSKWDGTIEFTQGRHEGRPYIECLDNGSGMTRARLTTMFARAGKRYEQDPGFVQERRDWRRANIDVQAMNSRFGIGVFSYFMLADEVVVWTRAVDRFGQVGAEKSLKAEIQSGSGLLQINDSYDSEVPEHGGTRVRLYLAEPQQAEKTPSLVEALRSVLWLTEYDVTATELRDDRREALQESWEPGRLHGRDDWFGEPVRVSEDAWLVQGPGQLLLDGVVVQRAPETFGRVVNLRERHSPQPSVDRNQLLHHDAELVMEELVGKVGDALDGCTEVSLPWLWTLAREAPRLAVAVLDALPRDTTAVLELENASRLTSGRHPLSRTGCFPCDSAAMNSYTGFLSLHPQREAENALFEHWQSVRLGLLQDEDGFPPPGYPRPEGADALLFRDNAPRDWQPVLQSAAQLRAPVRKVLRGLRRYAVTGVTVPEVEDIRSLDALMVGQQAVDLYSAYLDLQQQYPRHAEAAGLAAPQNAGEPDRAPAVHAPLLAVCALHHMTLAEGLELLDGLRHLAPDLPPPPELGALARQRPTRQESARLALTGPGETPWRADSAIWRSGSVGPVDLNDRARPPFSLGGMVRRIEQFAPLGFGLEAPVPQSAPPASPLSPNVRRLLSRDLDGEPPWLEGEISFEHLFDASRTSRAQLGEVAEVINTATPVTGAFTPVIPTDAYDWKVPDWVYHAMSGSGAGRLTPWLLVGSFYLTGTPDITELRRAVRALDACGLISWGDADADVLERQALSPHRLLNPAPFYGTLVGSASFNFSGAFDTDGACLAYSLACAAHDGVTLDDAVDELSRLDTHLPLKVEQVPAEAGSLRPTGADLRVLGPKDGDRYNAAMRFRDELRIADLLRHAAETGSTLGDTVRHLARFAPLGAPAPPGDFRGPDAESLAGFTPDRFDHAAFDRGLLGPGLLGPLELVLISGRFGWTLGRAYERYAPFRCLGLRVTVARPTAAEADLKPDWRDVILLTERLTGRPPALTGAVPEAHIALCAEETGLTVARVRTRLEEYAGLLALSLPTSKEHIR